MKLHLYLQPLPIASLGFPGGAGGKASVCQFRRHKRPGFDLWVWNIPWKWERLPSPVFLPGKSQGQRRLVGYSPWGHKESDRTEGLTLSLVVVVSTYKRLLYKIKKAEHQRIDAFKLWCWKRLLRVPRRAKRSNQSILNDINPEYSLEGQVLKLKFQYFGHLMQRTNSLEKTLMLEKIEGQRKKG